MLWGYIRILVILENYPEILTIGESIIPFFEMKMNAFAPSYFIFPNIAMTDSHTAFIKLLSVDPEVFADFCVGVSFIGAFSATTIGAVSVTMVGAGGGAGANGAIVGTAVSAVVSTEL